MINLLPYETKKQLKAARNNMILVRYLITLFIAMAFLGLLILGAYYILLDSKNTAEMSIAKVQTNNSSYSPSVSTSSSFNDDLKIANKILNQQTSYSTLLLELAKSIPADTILESPIVINRSTIDLPLTLKAYSKNSTDDSLSKSMQNSKFFQNYSLKSLNSSSSLKNYPYLITFSININKAQLR